MEQLMPNKMVKAGEIVFNEGDAPDEGIYYICYGDVEISRKEVNQQRVLAKLGEGGVFGEMGIVNAAPRNATVRALTDCGFYTLSQKNFQHRINQLDPVVRGVFRVLVLTIRDFIEQRDVWLGQLQFMMQHMDQMTGEASSQSPIDARPPASETGNLADGVARKMNY